MGFLGWATFAGVCLAMVGAGHGVTFEEQFTAFSSDGYHVQVASDGQEAKVCSTKSLPHHDERDFEFLGNSFGQPCVLQTNVFASGVGRREQRIILWFDPSADFRNYGVLWNKNQNIFTVDNKPIRVFKNQQDLGMAYPNSKPMGLYASLWNGDQWATQGGLVKLNWTHAPFVISFREFSTLDGCVVTDNDISPCTAVTSHWWEASAYQTIDRNQAEQILWVKDNYEVYDYCTDTKRYIKLALALEAGSMPVIQVLIFKLNSSETFHHDHAERRRSLRAVGNTSWYRQSPSMLGPTSILFGLCGSCCHRIWAKYFHHTFPRCTHMISVC